MIHAIWVWWKGSPVIANASGCSFVIAANAVANSMRGPTPTEMTVTPNLGAARCSSSNWRTFGGVVRIPQKGYARDGWNNLLENLQPLGTDVWAKDAVAGDISSRSGEAWHEPGAHGIADRDHDDGNGGGGLLGRQACGRAEGRNDVHRATNERPRGLGKLLRHFIAIRILEGDVLAFEVTEIAQPVTEGVLPGRVINDADTRNLPRLLRARRKRPRSRAAEQRDELAPLHSITSSASASSLAGISSPSTFAVLMFITRSNLVGCTTGKSAGLAPWRIRPV